MLPTPPVDPASATDDVEATARRTGAAPRDRLAFARTLTATTPPLTVGTAARVFATLDAVARADVALARTVEPHLDAVGILAQAGVVPAPETTWGVFAAEAPGTVLAATDAGGGGAVLLDGRKPWCSLASSLTHALMTAHRGDDRVLVAVDLRHPGVRTHDETWAARGLPDVPSGPVDLDHVPGTVVGGPGWYTTRPGFAWGGIGVAACWYGGAVGLARTLREHVRTRPEDPLAQRALGATVVDLADAEDALRGAAAAIDSSTTDAPSVDWALLAQVVRSRVRAAAEHVRRRVVATVGPAPLTADPALAARVADLELYLLQDHGDRDLARIGRTVLDRGGLTW